MKKEYLGNENPQRTSSCLIDRGEEYDLFEQEFHNGIQSVFQKEYCLYYGDGLADDGLRSSDYYPESMLDY